MSEIAFDMGEWKRDPDGDTAAYEFTESQQRYLFIKRILDILLAAAAVMLLAGPMLLLAVLHKALTPGEPVFFLQKRIGREERLFTLIKFSSMKSGGPRYMAARDFSDREEYVTGYGQFLRNTSLDELPQLFQVLSGKMSLIGPRPLIPQEERVHAMRRRAGVYRLRPGMTGWAQVNGRERLSDEAKAAYDREYLENMSFSMDWKIFRMTVEQMIRNKNGAAEGHDKICGGN